jgi:hypothetical protein
MDELIPKLAKEGFMLECGHSTHQLAEENMELGAIPHVHTLPQPVYYTILLSSVCVKLNRALP